MTDAEIMKWIEQNWFELSLIICLLFIGYFLCQIRDQIKRSNKHDSQK